jgi:heme exporter protein C
MRRMKALVLPVLTIGLVGAGFAMAVAAPPEQTQGEFAKMLFVHVPSVLAAYAAFAIALIGGVAYLITHRRAADRMSASAVEVGVVFVALTLVTGMIWGRPTWGVWWDWGDARMMSTALMFFFYLGYLALRRAIPDPTVRARRSAYLAIIAFVQVPIVHFSVTWFRTLHQPATIIRPDVENAPIDPVFGQALGVNTLAFLFVLAWFLQLRYRRAVAEEAQEELIADTELAGAAITAPELGTANG